MNETISAELLYLNITKLFEMTGALNIPLFKNAYVQSLVLFIVLLVLVNIIVYVVKKYIGFMTRKTRTKLDDMLMDTLQQPITYVLYIFALKIAIMPLVVPAMFLHILDTVIIIIITFIAIRTVDILLDTWGKEFAKRTKSSLDDEILPLVHKASKAVLILIGLMFVLSEWGIEIGPLLASLGIAGIAVAFALQTTLGNIFGGIALILDKAFKVGDKIVLDSGEMGTVQDVGLRSTKILNFDGELITIPNGQLANMKIINWGEPAPKARFTVNFGVEYGTDVDKVKDIVMKEIKKIDAIVDDPEPQVYFDSMGDFSLNFMARCWVADYNDRYFTKEKLTKAIYEALSKNNIGIPFPTHTVYLHKEKGK